MGKKAKKRAVKYNEFQDAFKRADRGVKDWQKRCQSEWARIKDNDVLLRARFNELNKVGDMMQTEKEKQTEAKGIKRSNPFEKWRTKAKKPKGEIGAVSDPAQIAQPLVELDDAGPGIDLPATESISKGIETEPPMPLKPLQPAEAPTDAEATRIKEYCKAE